MPEEKKNATPPAFYTVYLQKKRCFILLLIIMRYKFPKNLKSALKYESTVS